jgi:hypothetical protein
MVVSKITLLIGTVLGQKHLTINLITTVYVTVGLAENKTN